jgi:hypothetical protein
MGIAVTLIAKCDACPNTLPVEAPPGDLDKPSVIAGIPAGKGWFRVDGFRFCCKACGTKHTDAYGGTLTPLT